MKSPLTNLLEYLERPYEFWPLQNPRQAEKLSRTLQKALAANNSGLSDMAIRLITRAMERQSRGAKTIHIVNIGSSGSHWLEAVMRGAGVVLNGGEIYFPQSVKEMNVPSFDRRLVLEALHILHADPNWISEEELIPLTNSAHTPVLPHSELFGEDLKRLLLIRDPYDIVISRTYRKDEYRNYIAPDSSDEMYFKENTKKVVRFYDRALKHNADSIIKYEDMLSDAYTAVGKALEELGLLFSSSALEHSVAAYHKYGNAERAATCETGFGNLNVDRRPSVPKALEQLGRQRLAGLRQRLGYL